MSNSSSRPIEDVLNQIEQAADQHDPLTFGNVLDTMGNRSFAPILLLIGSIMLVPGPADIPGVPVLLGLLIIIVAGQLILKREHLWIPGWMERRKVTAQTAHKMVSWFRKPARWIDRLTKPRYHWLIQHAGALIIGIACILVAMTTPILEFIPFSANLAGAAIVTFSVALLAKDGLLAGLAMALTLSTFGIVAYQLLSR